MAARLRLTAAVLAVALAVMFQGTAEAATYVVGDAMGWAVPTTNDDAYENWAFGKNFTVGDVLVFNFVTGSHDVAQVSEQGEDDCNGASPIRQATTGPANMTLTTAGRNYFICTFGGHCNAGQKLDINVLEGARSTTPAPVTPAPVTPAPAAPRKAVTYVVGDAMGWVVPPGRSDDTYEAWAFGKTFYVGDVLVFNFTTGRHDVAQVTEQASDDCIGTNPIRQATAGPAKMTLTTAGMNYFICTFGGHCDAGQELQINVLAAPLTPATTPAMSPAPTPTPAMSPAPTTTASSPAPATSTATPPATGAEAPATTATGPSALSPSGGSTTGTPASGAAASVGSDARVLAAALLTVGVALVM